MGLRIVCGNEDWSILLKVDPAICALLTEQKTHADEAGRAGLFVEVVSQSFASALKGVLGTDLRFPTQPQMDLAILIARELGVPIPSEVLKFRGAMGQFLSTYRRAYHGTLHRREEKAQAWEFQP